MLNYIYLYIKSIANKVNKVNKVRYCVFKPPFSPYFDDIIMISLFTLLYLFYLFTLLIIYKLFIFFLLYYDIII
jgi:hypothetical protein